MAACGACLESREDSGELRTYLGLAWESETMRGNEIREYVIALLDVRKVPICSRQVGK